jgi:Anti-sigma-K factor rskA, C-terminal
MWQLLAGASVDADRPATRGTTDPTGPLATVEPRVTTVSDIPIVQLPAFEDDSPLGSPTASMWAVDVPTARRPSPLTLAVLGVVAGIAAMVLGSAAVISAGGGSRTTSERAAGSTPAPARSTLRGTERHVLALLAKPSTKRIVFRGSRGLVLAVGSGGRAAILIRGLKRAAPGKPYAAWIVTPGAVPVRAARFVGTERAVFLSARLRPKQRVIVSSARPVGVRPANGRFVAVLG